MGFYSEESSSEEKYSVPERYRAIENANLRSFYFTNPYRSFDIYQSINSVGDARVDYTDTLQSEAPLIPNTNTNRYVTGGNMSTVGGYGPIELPLEERSENAKKNMQRFFESISVPATSVYLLNPNRNYSTPIDVVNVDTQKISDDTEWPLRLENSGDFIYTRDPNKVLAVRPADCPVMIASANTPEGGIYMMVHYAWAGAASGYVEQTAEIFDSLGVDRSSLEIYLSPGGQAETFTYTDYPQDPRKEYPAENLEKLFRTVTERVKDDGSTVYNFRIDTPKYVYDQVLKHLNVQPKQVFCDTSDTSSLDSGYSSHGRSVRLQDQGESNTRDIVVAIFRPLSSNAVQ